MSDKDVQLIEDNKVCDEKRIENLADSMKEELEALKEEDGYLANDIDLDNFYDLFKRYISTRDKKIVWSNIKPPGDDCLIKYEDCKSIEDKNLKQNLLNKLAVLKLNGGLGTTMGCVGPKSSIHVRNCENFLDMCVKHIDNLNKEYDIKVPLILMNSYNTEKVTNKLIKRYKGIRTFTQSVFPRLYADSLLPVCPSYKGQAMYPPGHGDLFIALKQSGQLEKLISEGKEYLFVSNIDNLAATVDFAILNHVVENKLDFMMEVTPKTRADVKGGTIIEYENALRLLEIAQVSSAHKSDFTSVRKFKIFNTNSVWINLKAIKEILENGPIELDIIENKKTLKQTSECVIQLETAIGAAIKYFKNSKGMVVPRTRFLPVKTTSDLFLIQSNLFIEDKGSLKINPKRLYETNPVIRLIGPCYKDVNKYLDRFNSIPDVLELEHLTVSGNVRFGKNVVLKGTVIIIADENSTIDIPDGAILEDNILFGNLPIINH
ncbi:UTP-glucose-1-phosphate uridylyltransferase [Binucleata daphniae]